MGTRAGQLILFRLLSCDGVIFVVLLADGRENIYVDVVNTVNEDDYENCERSACGVTKKKR